MAEERRVEYGQRVAGALSYRTVNTMLELVRQQRLGRLGPQGSEPVPVPLGVGLEVLVQNQTGTLQPAGSVLSILTGTPLLPRSDGSTDPAPDFLARPAFFGTVPAASSDQVAVLKDGIPAGDLGVAIVRGLAVVLVTINTAGDGYALPVAGDATQMTSGGSGNPILWTQSGGTGQTLAVVLLDPETAPLTGCYQRVQNVTCGASGTGSGGPVGGLVVTYVYEWYTAAGILECDCCDGYSYLATACSSCSTSSTGNSSSGNAGNCCPGVTLPPTLHATVSGCANTVTLHQQANGTTWSASSHPCPGVLDMEFSCAGSAFALTFNGVPCRAGSANCAAATWSFTCGGSTVTVTE